MTVPPMPESRSRGDACARGMLSATVPPVPPVQDFNAQDLANMLWAMAKTSRVLPEVFG